MRQAAADYLMDGHNQYPPMMGTARAAPGGGRARQALPGPRHRLAERGAGDVGRDRGAGRLPVRPDRAGRRGRADRAALRFLSADRAPGRGHPEAGAARAADLEPAARGAGGGVQRPHQAHPVQHADEPVLQGVRPRGARVHRRALPEARRLRGVRRGLRAHHLRRPPAPVDHDPAGHARAHRADRLGRQELQRDRLEGRLCDGAAGHDEVRSPRRISS